MHLPVREDKHTTKNICPQLGSGFDGFYHTVTWLGEPFPPGMNASAIGGKSFPARLQAPEWDLKMRQVSIFASINTPNSYWASVEYSRPWQRCINMMSRAPSATYSNKQGSQNECLNTFVMLKKKRSCAVLIPFRLWRSSADFSSWERNSSARVTHVKRCSTFIRRKKRRQPANASCPDEVPSFHPNWNRQQNRKHIIPTGKSS